MPKINTPISLAASKSMRIPTPEELRLVENKLLDEGVLTYTDWLYYQVYSADGQPLTAEEVDTICTAALLAEEASEQAPVAVVRKEKSKGGRPAKGSEKLKVISTMVSPVRHAQLHAEARELDLTISEFVRPQVDPKGARGQKRVARIMRRGLSLEQRKGLRSLVMMAADLDQSAKDAQAAGDTVHASILTATAKQIRVVIQSFSK